MKPSKQTKYYPPAEERVNILSHTVGVVFSMIALVLLIIEAYLSGNFWRLVSFTVFGLSLVILFSASTYYHSTKEPQRRNYLRVVDHAAIYILIAGTYTPFTLVTLHGWVGWLLFGLVWSMAVVGITLKLFFTGRYTIVSTLMYVFMGWIIVFAINPLMQSLSTEGLNWLVAGGIAYTVGAILYAIKKIKFNHAIFHILVLVGSFCHFISIYYYV